MAGLASQYGGFISAASSTVAGTLQVAGALAASSTLSANNLVVAGTGTSTFVGGIRASYLDLSGTSATSTAANGIDLANGCFSINGTCVGGGGGGGGVQLTDANTWTALNIFSAGLISSASSTFSSNLNVSGNFYASSTITTSGNGINYLSRATSTIIDNTRYAWTIATSTTAKPLIRIDTTTNAEEIVIGGASGASDVIIGAVGTTTNLVFEESATIHGQGANTLTFGASGDKINFAVNTGFGTTSPWRTLSVSGQVGFEGLNSTSTLTNSLCIGNTFEVLYRSGASCNTSSSLRYKENVEPLPEENGLAEVMALQPVSFYFKPSYLGGFISDPNWTVQHVGFIAEEVQQVDPRLVTLDSLGHPEGVRYENISAILTRATQELNLRLEAIASSTASTTPSARSFAEEFFQNIFERIKTWLADAANGIGDLFANTFRAKEKICVDDQCLTKDDIRKLLELANSQAVSAPAPVSEPEPEPAADAETPDTESPVITLNGSSTIEIEIGTAWVDPGATVTDNVSENLGIHYTVDGVLTGSEGNQLPHEVIDTSVAGEHTIIYSATDQAGNTGTAERILMVRDQASETSETTIEDVATTTIETATTTETAAELPSDTATTTTQI